MMVNKMYRLLRLKSLTSRLFFWVILLLCLSSSLFLLSYIHIGKDEQINKTKANIEYALTHQKLILNSWVEERAREINYLTSLSISKNLELDLMKETFQNYTKQHDQLNSIVFVNEDGLVLLDSAAKDIMVNSTVSLADRDYFIAAQKGKASISNVSISKSTGAPVIIFSSPLLSETDEFQGLIFGSTHLSKLADMLSESIVGESGEITLINQEGIILAQLSGENNQDNPALGTKLDSEVIDIIDSNDQTLASYINANGEKVFGSFVSVHNEEYYVINEISKQEVLQSHHHMIRTHLLITFVVLIITITFIFPISRHLLQPLDCLMTGFREIKKGNYNTRLGSDYFISSPVEFRRSMEVFNEMSATIQEKEYTLQQLSSTDELTGIPNRRAFEEVLDKEWRDARRNQTPLAIAFLDVDSFKEYNDAFGHQVGDQCLRTIAQSIKGTIKRPRDVVARYGGEEFIIALPETNTDDAALIAERIRAKIEKLQIPHAKINDLDYVTVSIGVASSTPTATMDKKILIERADLALYEAKSKGRNVVKVNK